MTPRAIAALSHADALAELNRLHGYDAIAQTGAIMIDACLGDAEVKLEFEIEPGEDGDGWNEPCYPDSITLLGVLVNGCWCDVDLFDSDMRDQWEQAATDWLQEQRDTAQADHAESMARDRDEVYA